MQVIKDIKNGRVYRTIIIDDNLQITLGPGCFTYENIVAAIINQKYDSNKMQAIVNNYLFDNDAYKAEFEEMQNYRKKAKEIARNLLEHQTN